MNSRQASPSAESRRRTSRLARVSGAEDILSGSVAQEKTQHDAGLDPFILGVCRPVSRELVKSRWPDGGYGGADRVRDRQTLLLDASATERGRRHRRGRRQARVRAEFAAPDPERARWLARPRQRAG